MTGRPTPSTLGIIAGAGHLPLRLAETCRANGRPVFVLVFDAESQRVFSHLPHATAQLGAIGEALAHFRRAGVRDIVMAGKMKRPSLSGLKLDVDSARLLAYLGAAFFSGDDALLKSVIRFLEHEGFHIVGADEILADLLAPEGVLGNVQPDARSQADILQGIKAAKELGKRDIGQAVIVENGSLLGTEDREGTDALIARCAPLKREHHAGVLVKARKPNQERRVDLPAIGVRTVENVHAAGLRGIAVEARGSLILDREQVIAKANALGIFVVGVRYE